MSRQLKTEKACDWLAALDRRHAHLEATLREALACSLPGSERLNQIKSEKLRVKDQIASLNLYLRGKPISGSEPSAQC
ncbi:DUF465 domain-containing protein [Roseomonas sp. KE2513]|uniref:DUF465 domain-containing protein n=1 Tax=Roseomonas sp. KE2513 TaxID=2479202 RepID=UPI0018E01E3A|nr:DUF465 domain-containing protein [Roseomonas sp. KE2513]